jgi:hypothetical protein
MKTVKMVSVFCLLILTAGCIGPARILPIEEIQTNETAFIVPMEGAAKADQAKFMSLNYLEEAKAATKRVVVPIRKRKVGRGYWNYEWIPSMRVIKVNRLPVTREWTESKATGTSTKDEAISVESLDSIGFAVGVNLTSFISEEDAAKFLYWFAGKPLNQVVDENIRGFVTSIMSREFGSRDLQSCKTAKKEIMDITFSKTKEHFQKMGITISNLGLAEGLLYEDKEIQQAINNVNVAEMDVQKAVQERKAQQERNLMKVEIATAERQAAEEFAKAQVAMIAKVKLEIEKMRAQAQLNASTKWDGKVPQSILPQNANLLFGLDSPNGNSSE